MTVKEFLRNHFGGDACLSIQGYCEEEYYDYLREPYEWELSDDKSNRYKSSYISEEPWWNEVKDMEIKEWTVLGGGMYEIELYIYLAEN